MITNLNELETNIRNWGLERNITQDGGATVQAQISKAMEEMAECIGTLGKIAENNATMKRASGTSYLVAHEEYEKLQKDLQDDFGDIVVCIIQAARLADTNLVECLNQSWEDIRDRKGTMVDGKFVKEII